MKVLAAAATNLFVGSEDEPRQVVRVTVVAEDGDGGEPARVTVEGDRVRSESRVTVGPLRPGDQATLEIGVTVDEGATSGRIPRRGGRRRARRRIGSPSLRLRGRRARLAAVHDLPLPLRPGLVEHPGGVHGVLGDSHPLPRCLPGAGPGTGQGAPRDGPPGPRLQVRARRARLPQAVLGRLPGGPGVHPPSCWRRAGWS